jgi:hypothetical protein
MEMIENTTNPIDLIVPKTIPTIVKQDNIMTNGVNIIYVNIIIGIIGINKIGMNIMKNGLQHRQIIIRISNIRTIRRVGM